MTTATLQLKVQRSRFAQHALSALTSRLPGSLRALSMNALTLRSPTRAERASREAQDVRDIAQAYTRTDPGFASDLYVAASRHEGLYAD